MSEYAKPLFETVNRKFTSFLNVDVCQDLDSTDAKVAFVGVPYGIPYEMAQCRSACAPDYIREKSLRFIRSMSDAHNFDWDLREFNLSKLPMIDCGNIYGDPMDFRATVDRATAAIAKMLDKGIFPVVFGGDDAIPIPVIRACKDHGPVTVIQIDEHLDFADERYGVKEGFSNPMRRASEMPWVKQIIHLGIHGYGCQEQVAATLAAGNKIITDREFHQHGTDSVLSQIPDDENYFITVDFDGLDPVCFPAVSNPEPGGMTFEQTNELFRGLAKKGKILGIDFAEMVPEHDLNGISGYCVGRLVVNLLHAVFQA